MQQASSGSHHGGGHHRGGIIVGGVIVKITIISIWDTSPMVYTDLANARPPWTQHLKYEARHDSTRLCVKATAI